MHNKLLKKTFVGVYQLSQSEHHQPVFFHLASHFKFIHWISYTDCKEFLIKYVNYCNNPNTTSR